MNPILLDIPESFETERLLIRAPRPGDGAEINAAMKETLEELKPWMEWAREDVTPEDTETFIRRSIAQWAERTSLSLKLYDKETGLYVGGSGLDRMNWDVPLFEIGYWCR